MEKMEEGQEDHISPKHMGHINSHQPISYSQARKQINCQIILVLSLKSLQLKSVKKIMSNSLHCDNVLNKTCYNEPLVKSNRVHHMGRLNTLNMLQNDVFPMKTQAKGKYLSKIKSFHIFTLFCSSSHTKLDEEHKCTKRYDAVYKRFEPITNLCKFIRCFLNHIFFCPDF